MATGGPATRLGVCATESRVAPATAVRPNSSCGLSRSNDQMLDCDIGTPHRHGFHTAGAPMSPRRRARASLRSLGRRNRHRHPSSALRADGLDDGTGLSTRATLFAPATSAYSPTRERLRAGRSPSLAAPSSPLQPSLALPDCRIVRDRQVVATAGDSPNKTGSPPRRRHDRERARHAVLNSSEMRFVRTLMRAEAFRFYALCSY